MPDPENPQTDPKTQTPPWGDDFDAEKAWNLVQNLRADKSSLQEKLTSAEGERDTATAEVATLTQRVADVESERDGHARTILVDRVRSKHELSDELVDFLTGSTEEELTAQAEKLSTLGKVPAPKEGEQEPKEPAAPAEPQLPVKPKPNLTPGHGGEQTAARDYDAIVANARNASR